jgi:thiol-disulfide isomerase/thioredoxin
MQMIINIFKAMIIYILLAKEFLRESFIFSSNIIGMPVIHIPSKMNQTTMKDNASAINKFLKSGKNAFVLIYMDGCGPCMNTHPKWLELESDFKDHNDIGVFDIEMSNLGEINHEGLKRNIAGYPTMRHVHGDSANEYEKCENISHDRTRESFVDWINKMSSNKKSSMRGGSRAKMAKRTRKTIKRTKGKRKWSLKYKRSINCRRPRGFSQRQYCKRRNKLTR